MQRLKKKFLLVFEKVINHFDFYLDSEEIRFFLISQISNFGKLQIEDEEMRQVILKIHENLSAFAWVEADQIMEKSLAANQGEVKRVQHFQSWNPNDENIVSHGVVKAGCCSVIEQMIFHGTKKEQQIADDQMERLLKHVEVRRKNALKLFDPELSKEEIWLERHAVSALFSIYARKVGDLRFLNASMKMNDWYFRRYENKPLDQEKAQYLLSLTEQERSATELI